MLPQHLLKSVAPNKKRVRVVNKDKLWDHVLSHVKSLFNQLKVACTWGSAMSKQGNDVNLPDQINREGFPQWILLR